MISLFSQINEIEKKDLCERIFKVSICFGTNTASLESETDPVDSSGLIEFVWRENLGLIVARKLSYEPNVTISKILQEFVDLLNQNNTLIWFDFRIFRN